MKNPIRLFPLLLILSISLSQYEYNQWNLREEIISRYDNGNKKLLIKYSGHGSNEIIVERIIASISRIGRPCFVTVLSSFKLSSQFWIWIWI